MDLGLAGKTVLITGGSQGVGAAAAELFAAEGCNLVLVARTEADLARVRDDIAGRHKVSVAIAPANLADPETPPRIAAKFPDVDILVNNAGAIPAGSIVEIDDATWRKGWDLKVFGYIGMTRSYYSLMQARKSGVIINVMGASAVRPGPRTIAIGMANATLNALTRALGGVAPADGIRVVGVNPGSIATERGIQMRRARAQALYGDPERWPELVAHMPFGRAGAPAEIAAAVVFLASTPAAYMSGTVVEVDGGVATKVDTY